MSTIPVSLPTPQPTIPKPPGWVVPVLIGSIAAQLVWDWMLGDSGEEQYDMGGWHLAGVCTIPRFGALRRWSNVGCLIGQAVNFPGIRPQDNYAAHCITYEAFPNVLRLSNSDVWERDQVGVLLPWEAIGEENLPPIVSVPVVLEPAVPYIPGLQTQPVLGSALPIPLPLNIPGVRPSVPPIPGFHGPTRWSPPRSYGVPVRQHTVTPGKGVEVEKLPLAVANQRPPAKTKEVKARYQAGLKSVLMRGLNTATEVNDFIEVLHSALPNKCKAKPVSLAPVGKQARTVFGDIETNLKPSRYSGSSSLPGWKVNTSVANDPEFERYLKPRKIKERGPDGKFVWKGRVKYTRTHRAPSVTEKLEALYRCWHEMDVRKAIGGLIWEAGEDFLYGQAARAVAKNLPASYKRIPGPLFNMRNLSGIGG